MTDEEIQSIQILEEHKVYLLKNEEFAFKLLKRGGLNDDQILDLMLLKYKDNGKFLQTAVFLEKEDITLYIIYITKETKELAVIMVKDYGDGKLSLNELLDYTGYKFSESLMAKLTRSAAQTISVEAKLQGIPVNVVHTKENKISVQFNRKTDHDRT